MALLTALALADAQRLGRTYGVDLESIEALSVGSVNSNFRATARDGRKLFARLYEEQGQAGAEGELALLEGLAAEGIPVSAPLPRSGPVPSLGTKPFAVFPWVEGEILCVPRVTPEACRRVGRALAQVHLASPKLLRLGAGRFGPVDMLERLARVEREASRPALLPDIARVRALYERYLAEREPSLPHGIVHGDLFRDNVLWQGGEIAALLDFESAFHGPLVYDLMVTIAAWCYRDAFELPLVAALVEGYAKERPLGADELRAARVEGALGCLRFATSRITDFELRAREGERPARDFRRFLARLDAIATGELASVLA